MADKKLTELQQYAKKEFGDAQMLKGTQIDGPRSQVRNAVYQYLMGIEKESRKSKETLPPQYLIEAAVEGVLENHPIIAAGGGRVQATIVKAVDSAIRGLKKEMELSNRGTAGILKTNTMKDEERLNQEAEELMENDIDPDYLTADGYIDNDAEVVIDETPSASTVTEKIKEDDIEVVKEFFPKEKEVEEKVTAPEKEKVAPVTDKIETAAAIQAMKDALGDRADGLKFGDKTLDQTVEALLSKDGIYLDKLALEGLQTSLANPAIKTPELVLTSILAVTKTTETSKQLSQEQVEALEKELTEGVTPAVEEKKEETLVIGKRDISVAIANAVLANKDFKIESFAKNTEVDLSKLTDEEKKDLTKNTDIQANLVGSIEENVGYVLTDAKILDSQEIAVEKAKVDLLAKSYMNFYNASALEKPEQAKIDELELKVDVQTALFTQTKNAEDKFAPMPEENKTHFREAVKARMKTMEAHKDKKPEELDKILDNQEKELSKDGISRNHKLLMGSVATIATGALLYNEFGGKKEADLEVDDDKSLEEQAAEKPSMFTRVLKGFAKLAVVAAIVIAGRGIMKGNGFVDQAKQDGAWVADKAFFWRDKVTKQASDAAMNGPTGQGRT